jgi:hypothetical protein
MAEWHMRLAAGIPEAILFYVYQHPAGRKVFPRAHSCMSVDRAPYVCMYLPLLCLTILLLQYWHDVGMWPGDAQRPDGSDEEDAEAGSQSALWRQPVDDIPEVCTHPRLSTLTPVCHI